MRSIEALHAALSDSNIKAFLAVIRAGEGTADEDGYRRHFGGELFDSFADHPRRAITKPLGGKPITSTAAGAYQFLSRTWDSCAKALELPDFSPPSQDLAAVFLIDRRRALADVLAGRIESAIAKCNREWASLPGSPYGQPTATIVRALETYRAHDGVLRPSAEPAPVETISVGPPPALPPAPPLPPPATSQEATAMSPFIAAALPAIIEAVPALVRIFGTAGSPTSERNAQAAELVVGIAKGATGARNEQELVEVIRSDPAAAAAVRESVEREWLEIDAASERSVVAARQFARDYASDKDVRTVFGSGLTFLEVLSLLLVVLTFSGAMWMLVGGDISPEFKGAIITLMLIAGFSGVREFWFGSSRDSQRKTEIMARER